MVRDLSVWLTIRGAQEATGLSPATLKRYAVRAQEAGHAVQRPVRDGTSKQSWRLDPDALRRWVEQRRARPAVAAPSSKPPDATVDGSPLAVHGDDVLARLVTVEESVTLLRRQIEDLRRTAVDEVQAARSALLAEKSVSEAIRTAQKAQAEAVTSRAEARRLHREADRQSRRGQDKDAAAAAAAALGQAVDLRSSQLDQLLVPGSPPQDKP